MTHRESKTQLTAPRWLWAPGLLSLALASCSPSPAPEPEAPPPSPSPTPIPTPSQTPSPTPEPTPTPLPTPTPYPYIPRKNVEVSRFYNGITIESELTVENSDLTPAIERRKLDSYVLEMNLRIQLPAAASTLEDFKKNDPGILQVWPGLPDALTTAAVSPAFATLYQNKVDYLRPRLGRLEEILSRHNFYDCDTILHLQHPQSGRRAIVASGDMDLNVDGSDGDRNVEIDGSSPFFQPQTSYRWPKQTERPNQFLARSEARLAEVRQELTTPKLDPAQKKSLENSREILTNRIAELKRWSFLISDTDPFIVLPGFMLRNPEGDYAPRLGDYAAVLFDGKIYPAILGDAGPSFKMGEASMRLCRAIEPRTTAARRAHSDLRVTYLVFPGTADPAAPPNLNLWNQRVTELAGELGLDTSRIQPWEDIVPAWPTPTPEPTPDPIPSPSVAPDPSPSPSPSPQTTPTTSPTAPNSHVSESTPVQ
jgi:hypothetical protein